jgi:hypothetical protein
MKRKKKINIIGLLVLIGLVTYLFLFGKLFPYSPIIIGFEKHELTNSLIYTQKGVSFNDYERIDTLIPPIEKFHDLKYLAKPKIFLFSDSISYIRQSLSKARFCAFYNGRIFITPWALKEVQSEKISLDIYLTHELSHSLLHQHSGLINASRYPKWLLEGIAVYSSNQMGSSFYPSKEDTYFAIAQGNFLPPFDFKTKREDLVKLDVKYRITFMYSEFACIVDYLVETFGRAKFILYMKSLIRSNDHDKIFKQIYGVDFDKFLIDFRQFVVKACNSKND